MSISKDLARDTLGAALRDAEREIKAALYAYEHNCGNLKNCVEQVFISASAANAMAKKT